LEWSSEEPEREDKRLEAKANKPDTVQETEALTSGLEARGGTVVMFYARTGHRNAEIKGISAACSL